MINVLLVYTSQKKLIVALLSLLVIGSAYVWWSNIHREDYIISDVPFFTIYNHTGEHAYIVTSQGAAVASLLEYFGESLSVEDYKKINSVFFEKNDIYKLFGIEEVKQYIDGLGYETRIERPTTLREVKELVMRGTPVVFSHRLTTDQDPSVRQSPQGLIIGVLEREDALIVHDYYWGYNKKIKWEDFKKTAIQLDNIKRIARLQLFYQTVCNSACTGAGLDAGRPRDKRYAVGY